MTEFIHYHYDFESKFNNDPLFKKLAKIKFEAYEALGFSKNENILQKHLTAIHSYLFNKNDMGSIDTVLTIDKDRHGFIISTKYDAFIEVYQLFVVPNKQKNKKLKLGTQLLNQNLQELGIAGISYINTQAEPTATGFYEKQGFKKSIRQPSLNTVFMTKCIGEKI